MKIASASLALGALIGALSISGNVAAQEQSAAQMLRESIPATVSVDFGNSRGAMVRAERVNNFYPADQFTTKLVDDVAFINAQGLHGRIYRVWVSDMNFNPKTGQTDPDLVGVFDPKTGIYDFESLAPYLSQASLASDSILVVLNLQSMVRAGWTPAQTRPVIKTIILELTRRYPKIQYIEAMNEADHNLRSFMNRRIFIVITCPSIKQ